MDRQLQVGVWEMDAEDALRVPQGHGREFRGEVDVAVDGLQLGGHAEQPRHGALVGRLAVREEEVGDQVVGPGVGHVRVPPGVRGLHPDICGTGRHWGRCGSGPGGRSGIATEMTSVRQTNCAKNSGTELVAQKLYPVESPARYDGMPREHRHNTVKQQACTPTTTTRSHSPREPCKTVQNCAKLCKTVQHGATLKEKDACLGMWVCCRYHKGGGWVGLGQGLAWSPTHGPPRLPCRTRLGGRTRVSGHKACRTVDRPQTPRWRSRAGDAAVPVCMCPCVSGGGGEGCGTPACSIVVRPWRTWRREVCAWCSRPRQGGWRA